ncbi:hypothetical protein ILUMI_04727 [Ignelater luminosus]|uniref:Pleckstrin homology domain-containing family J member 1 n=1 Tax=Ignelater luminosus TaxID=2038154 RepID=A0A8K0DCA6_IGNLU|nr:hypothetical protein ILUMI_04727 [Ignelater luminosus]
MRFNDRELAKVGEGRVDLEGILHHMKPQENDWSDWYQQHSFKERTFKLISNLLFYYRVNEPEPLGVLVLENVQVAYERPHKGIPFAFSLTFKVNDKCKDSERKHIFSCRCQEDVNKWVSTLKVASYEHWRSQFIILKTKISMRTGKDPVLDYLRRQHQNKENASGNSNSEKRVCAKKSTFQSHIEKRIVCESTLEISNATESSVISETSTMMSTELTKITKSVNSEAVPIGKLIDI